MELIRKIESHIIFIPKRLLFQLQPLFDGNVCSFVVEPDEIVPSLGMGLEETIEDDEGERILKTTPGISY
jgi:hypothetical protein